MSTRLLVFLILQSWRFPASGGLARWLVWSKLNKGILPSSLLLYTSAEGSQARINYQLCRLDISCCFLPLSHGTAGLMLLEGICALQTSGLTLLEGVTWLYAIVVEWRGGNPSSSQKGFYRIIINHIIASIWLLKKTNCLLNRNPCRARVKSKG